MHNEVYNYFTTERGQQIINGWMKTVVFDLFVGLHTPPPEDPFESEKCFFIKISKFCTR